MSFHLKVMQIRWLFQQISDTVHALANSKNFASPVVRGDCFYLVERRQLDISVLNKGHRICKTEIPCFPITRNGSGIPL
jgi:hypothetical protein